MRDLIWTLIIIWLVYKVVHAFQLYTANTRKVRPEDNTGKENFRQKPHDTATRPRDDGEYVDFEELS